MAEKEQSLATVKVPYLLNDPTIVAEQELHAAGLTWKLAGDPRQHSYVKSQSPFPGHLVPRGSVVDLFCVNGPTP